MPARIRGSPVSPSLGTSRTDRSMTASAPKGVTIQPADRTQKGGLLVGTMVFTIISEPVYS